MLASDLHTPVVLYPMSLAMLLSRLFESKSSYRRRKSKYIDDARNGRINELKECLREGRLRVDCQDKLKGETALLAAARAGQKEVIDLLLSHNGNIDMQSINFETALMAAVENGHKEVVELLLSHKCNMECQNKVGWTAIMIAANNGFKDIVELLIAHKCNIDSRGKLGRTAFDYACMQGHISISILLIEAGCNYSNKDNAGKSGMDHLKEKNRSAVKEVQAVIDAKLGNVNPTETSAFVNKQQEANVSFTNNTHDQDAEVSTTLSLKEKQNKDAAQKKLDEDTAAELVKKKQEQDAAIALFKKKQEQETIRQQEERKRLVNENIEEIRDIKNLLIKIGFSKGESKKCSEVLVLDHQINSEMKFLLKIATDSAYYYSELQLPADSIKLVERYLKLQAPIDVIARNPTERSASADRYGSINATSSSDNKAQHKETTKEFTFKGGVVMDAVPFVSSKGDTNNPSLDGIWSGTINMLDVDVLVKEAIRKRDIGNEAAILKHLQAYKDVSTGCIKMYGVDHQLPPSFIVIERFGINLRVKLLNNPRMDIKLRRIIFENMMKAIADLHGLSVMHGDIKPQNLLVDENYNVKLCDFDSARIVSEESIFPCDPLSKRYRFSPEWASPEVYNGSNGRLKTSFAIDMFSVGLIAALLEDKDNHYPNGVVLPLCDTFEYHQALTDESFLHTNVLKVNSRSLFRDTIYSLCSIDPDTRPSSCDILRTIFDKTSSTRHVEIVNQVHFLQDLVISRLDNIADILHQFSNKMNELISSNKDIEVLINQIGDQSAYMSVKQSQEMMKLQREIQQASCSTASDQITAINNKLNTILQDTWKIPTLAVVLKKSKNHVFRDDYALYFLCEHTLEPVACGPKGEGFEFKQLKEAYADKFKKMAPILMVGLIMLKIAVSVYGIPIPLPDMASLTKADATTMLNSMMKNLDVYDTNTKIQAIAKSKNPLDVINQATLTTEQQREAYESLIQFLDKPEYKPYKFGVVKVTSRSGITKWIKDDPTVIASFHECDGQRPTN